MYNDANSPTKPLRSFVCNRRCARRLRGQLILDHHAFMGLLRDGLFACSLAAFNPAAQFISRLPQPGEQPVLQGGLQIIVSCAAGPHHLDPDCALHKLDVPGTPLQHAMFQS